METPLRFAFTKGTEKWIFIEDTANGIDCNCECPNCHRALIAKNGGSERVHHFAHEGPPCENAGETAFHKFCKHIISQSKCICQASGEIFTYTRGEIEGSVGPRYIDVIAYNDKTGHKLAVEIKCTHAIENDKINFLLQEGYPILEIDVSDYDREMAPQMLTDLLLNKTTNKEDFPLLSVQSTSQTACSSNTKIDWEWVLLVLAFIGLVFAVIKFLSSKNTSKHKRLSIGKT
jgi:hypothetical protein